MRYVEGQNLVVERGFAEGKTDQLPRLARELVQRRVDVIVAVATAVESAHEATRTIPIVMGYATDPVGRGFGASLGRPGGNVTVVTYAEGPEIAGKRLDLIREAVPLTSRIAVLGAGDSGQSMRLRSRTPHRRPPTCSSLRPCLRRRPLSPKVAVPRDSPNWRTS